MMKKIISILYFLVCIKTLALQGQSATKLTEEFKVLYLNSETSGLHSGELDSATCVRMLQIAQELKNDSLLAISYNLIGEYISRIKGDNTNGLEYYFKAIPLAERSKDKRRLSSIFFDISLIYFNLQNNEEAVKYIRAGGNNLPDTLHPVYDFMLAQYQRGMESYFVLTKQPDSALAYAQPFLATSRKLNSPLFKFSAFFLTAAAYNQQGDKDLAETYFKKASNIKDSVNSVYGMLRFSVSYIPFLLNNNRLADAKMQAVQLLNDGDKLGNNDIKLAAAGFMRQIYDSLHKADSAYFYSRMEATTNAQIFNQGNINKIQALAFNEHIRNIEEEAKRKKEEEQRRQNIQFALIALGIITFIIIFLLLSRSIIINARVIEFFGVIALLLVFEFLNLLLHPFLERITHHSPVLMLLALVCIAALLVPLHHKLEHWATHKLVEKNKQIRLAAAKKTIEHLEENNS